MQKLAGAVMRGLDSMTGLAVLAHVVELTTRLLALMRGLATLMRRVVVVKMKVAALMQRPEGRMLPGARHPSRLYCPRSASRSLAALCP